MTATSKVRKAKPAALDPLCFFLFLGVFILDLWGICPSIYWRDGPEFTDVLYTLGIPHPAGSPTYLLFSKPFVLLPLGSVAFRTNLASAFWHAAGASIFFLFAKALSLSLLPKAQSWVHRAASAIATVNFAASPSLWLAAVTTEVYTLQAAFFLGVLLCAWLGCRSRDLRYLFFGAFLYGLSAGVHATAVFSLPAVFYFFFRVCPAGRRLEIFLTVCFFFLFGFSTYLFLPIRSVANPTFDWGNTETYKQFFSHLTDRKTKSTHFAYDYSSLLTSHGPRYIQHLWNELGLIGLGFGVLGFVHHLKREREFLVFMILMLFGNLIFYFNWKTGDGFIQSNWIISAWMTVGLAFCITALEGRKSIATSAAPRLAWGRVTAMSVAAFVVFSLFFPFLPFRPLVPADYARRAEFYDAEESARREMEKMSQDAMVITTLFWFPLRYLQDVEGYRQDLSIVMASDIIGPQFFNPVVQSRFPKLKIPGADPLTTPWYDYMPALINANIGGKDIYYEPSLTLVRPLHRNLLPDGFFFQVKPGEPIKDFPEEIVRAYLEGMRSTISLEERDKAFKTDLNSREYYMTFLLFSADFFLAKNMALPAQVLLKVASEIRPNHSTVEFYLAQCSLALGSLAEGLSTLNRVIENDPGYAPSYQLLARTALRLGDFEEAERLLTRTHAARDSDHALEFLLVEKQWRAGRFQQAQQELDQLSSDLTLEEDRDRLKHWRKILEAAQAS